jgi:type II secretory pathway pseudopilin PulG
MLARKQPAKSDGFTLFEVMMAAAVMLMAIVGMIQVITYGSGMLDLARKQSIAMQIIHGQIDNLRLNNWATVTVSPYIRYTSETTRSTGPVNIDNPNQATNITSGFVFGPTLPGLATGFKCTRVVEKVPLRSDLLQITFSVTWRSNTGRQYTRSGSTYFGKNGLYVTYQR